MYWRIPSREITSCCFVPCIHRRTERRSQFRRRRWTSFSQENWIGQPRTGSGCGSLHGSRPIAVNQKVVQFRTETVSIICHENNVSPLPACQQSLCRYVTHLANESFVHTSIKCYLAATSQLVLRGIKMVQVSRNKPAAC